MVRDREEGEDRFSGWQGADERRWHPGQRGRCADARYPGGRRDRERRAALIFIRIDEDRRETLRIVLDQVQDSVDLALEIIRRIGLPRRAIPDFPERCLGDESARLAVVAILRGRHRPRGGEIGGVLPLVSYDRREIVGIIPTQGDVVDDRLLPGVVGTPGTVQCDERLGDPLRVCESIAFGGKGREVARLGGCPAPPVVRVPTGVSRRGR